MGALRGNAAKRVMKRVAGDTAEKPPAMLTWNPKRIDSPAQISSTIRSSAAATSASGTRLFTSATARSGPSTG